QFGPSEDFAKYPRSFETDCEKLRQAGVDALLAPEAAEVYPKGFSTYVHVEGLSEKLEGRSRPGHFRGVSTVVLKLLEIVHPHGARPEPRFGDCSLPDRARTGRPRAFLPQRLSESRGAQGRDGFGRRLASRETGTRGRAPRRASPRVNTAPQTRFRAARGRR